MTAADARLILKSGFNSGEGFSFKCFQDQGLSAPVCLRLEVSDYNSADGHISGVDRAGEGVFSGAFREFLTTIPCFTPTTSIATASGQCAVADLRPDQRVITRDNGMQKIRWIGRREFGWRALGLNPLLRPIRIAANALADGIPARDMIVSPNHRILALDPTRNEAGEGLVQARDLLGRPGVSVVNAPSVEYVQILFDRHELILGDECWSESYEPTAQNLSALTPEARAELLNVLPEVESDTALSYSAVRPEQSDDAGHSA